MALYRHGVGRVRVTGQRSHPFTVPSGTAPPHPGYDEDSGVAKQPEVAERIEMSGGLVVESYGLYQRSSRPQPISVPKLEPEPEERREVAPRSPKDWRADFGLARSG